MGKKTTETEGLRKTLNQRNQSLLAHGFNPIKEKHASNIMETIKSWLTSQVEEFEEMRTAAEFVKLNHASF